MIARDTNMSLDMLEAYEYCRQITRRAAKTFYWGSLFLPYQKRQATWALYAFCRSVDDIADHPERHPDQLGDLACWHYRMLKVYDDLVSDPITLAWHDLLQTYPVPLEPALDLIAGMEMDLRHEQPTTFEDLHLYCYRVAGTVGLLMTPILGYSCASALPCAVDLGIAMQLTNILRDVGEDLRHGRIYLPREDLARFDYSEADLRNQVIDDRFIALMQFEIARAEDYFNRARPGIEKLDPRAQLAIRASAEMYRGILPAIVANGYDVFTRRAYVPFASKVMAMPRLWLDMKLGRGQIATQTHTHLAPQGIKS